MAAIAAFAGSSEGRMYAAVCDRWNVDPAASISDDVVAYALRASLMVQTVPQETTVEEHVDEYASAAAENERLWLGQ